MGIQLLRQNIIFLSTSARLVVYVNRSRYRVKLDIRRRYSVLFVVKTLMEPMEVVRNASTPRHEVYAGGGSLGAGPETPPHTQKAVPPASQVVSEFESDY